MQHGRQGRIVRATVGHDQRLGEDLPGANHIQYDIKEDGWGKQGQRNRKKASQGAGPIDLGGFIECRGNATMRSNWVVLPSR